MLATGLTSLFAFADLGLGNTLMSLVARHQTDEDSSRTIQRIVSTAYFALTVVTIALMALVFVLMGFAPWRDFLGIPEASRGDAQLIIIVTLLFLANIPLGLINRVLFGMQKVAHSYYWQSVGPLVSVALAIILPLLWNDPLAFVIAVAAGPVSASVLSSIWYYSRSMRAIAPRPSRPDRSDLSSLATTGLTFSFISVTMAIATAMDILMLPHYVTLEEVADFSVVWRVFAQVGMVLSLMSLPFWPIAADALARGEMTWIRRTLRRMQVWNVAAITLIGAVAVGFGQFLLDVWLGDQIHTTRLLFLGFTTWWALQAVTYPLFMVLNAAVRIKAQLVCWILFTAGSFLAKVLVLRVHPDPDLLPWISSITYSVILLPCAVLGTRRELAHRGQTAVA